MPSLSRSTAAVDTSPRAADPNELPFTSHTREGERLAWAPVRDMQSPTQAARNAQAYVGALAQLARVDENAAWGAAKNALLAPEWKPDGWEEEGFADALVAAAIVGWRAQRCASLLPFACSFDANTARTRALAEQVEAMQAQLRALNQRPWRTLDEAGLV